MISGGTGVNVAPPTSAAQGRNAKEATPAMGTSNGTQEKKGPFGGFVEQPEINYIHFFKQPAEVMHNQMSGEVVGYRKQAIADGIPFRKAGLFPPGDPFLTSLINQPSTYPFEKHLAGRKSRYEQLPKGAWPSGNEAAENGLDLRLFWKEPEKVVVGAARLGDRASIGNGFYMPAHGGAIETLLDEATAELGKMTFAPMVATAEISFVIKKPVPIHTSLRIDCKMVRTDGMWCYVTGSISLPGKDGKDTLLVTCDAKLVDVGKFFRALA